MSIQSHISSTLEFAINIAGTDFDNVEDAIVYAYRCGLASANSEQAKKSRESV
jgi:hypothetical protein